MLLLGFTPLGNGFTESNLTIFIKKYGWVVGQDNPFQFLFHTMYVTMYGLFNHIAHNEALCLPLKHNFVSIHWCKEHGLLF